MRGKWNYSTDPPQYEVFDENNKIVYSGLFHDSINYMEGSKHEYILIDWDRPCGQQRIKTDKKIFLTNGEAYDLNKLLTLNGENKRYIKL